MEEKEIEAMSKGLKIALKYADNTKDVRRFIVLQGMYAESLVIKRLLENKHSVEFYGPSSDILVNGKKIEVKCGKFKGYYASASFKEGKQIKEEQFDYCVFVVINGENFEPEKFFIFSLDDLKECSIRRPGLTKPNTPCILFYYKDFNRLEKDAKEAKEPVFEIEKKLHKNPELFENRWDNFDKSH